MKRFIAGLVLLCCSSLALAEISLKVDKPKVQLGQTFTLTLTIEGSLVNAMPDLMPLQQDFTIEGTESRINSSIVNGKVHSISEWILVMSAKRTGLLTIPALQVGKEKTSALTIEVTEEAPVTTQQPLPQFQSSLNQPKVMHQQQDILLKTEISDAAPFVNQQIIYTVKLYNSSRLLDANYHPPQVDDALFVPMGNGRRYQANENGRIYTVEEQQFAIFPQKTGYIKINPPSFNALIYDLSPKRVSVEAQPTTLNVKTIPFQFTGKDWLPAKQVALSESYDKSTGTLVEGNTLVRTVVLQATAIPAELLPNLDFASSDKFSVYPEKPITNNQFRQQDLVGTSTVKVTYLFNKAGKITIPPLSLTWFNTNTGKEEVSSLPGFTIDVTAAAGTSKPAQTPTPAAQPAAEPQPALPPRQENPSPNQAPREQPRSSLPWWIAGVLALCWLFTLAAWRRQCLKQNSSAHSQGQILQDLQQACLSNKAKEARNLLLKWGRLQWPRATLLNLFDLEKLVGDSVLREQISQLAQGLYQGARDEWQGKALWQAIAEFKPIKGAKAEEGNPLPPLNRI